MTEDFSWNPVAGLPHALTQELFELSTDRIHARSRHLMALPKVIFASEPMDDDPRWQLMEPGELAHVDVDLQIDRRVALPDPPKHQLRQDDLTAQAAASQHASVE